MIVFFFLFFFFLQPSSYAEGELKPLRCIIHLHSDWSFLSESNSLETLAEWGKASGVDVLIFTDHALVRASWGLFPFRRTLHYTEDKASVFKKGTERYLLEIHQLQEKYPSLLLIPALEVAPFYYWSGNPFQGTLTLREWHRHLLVLGIEDPEVLKKMPLLSNPYAHPFTFLGNRLFFLCPSVICFVLFGYLRKRSFYRDEQGRSLRYTSKSLRWVEYSFFLVAVLFLIESVPFGDPFDPYHGDRGAAPYQKLIDYVNAHGGFVFWAHPEVEPASSDSVSKGIRIVTEPYGYLLSLTRDYTGFAAYATGKGLIQKGGDWDQLLMMVCQKIRKSPIWVMSETDFIGGFESFRLNETVVWVEERSKTGVLKSLREGRMCAVMNTRNEHLSLDFFSVTNEEGKKGGLGEEISSQGKVRVAWRFRVSQPTYTPWVTLIRSGKPLGTFPVKDGEEAFFDDTLEDPKPEKIYYRLEVEEPPFLTNPIFVSLVPRNLLSEKQ